MLESEVNTDLLYKVQRELRNFGIYGDMDIIRFCEVYFASGAQGSSAQDGRAQIAHGTVRGIEGGLGYDA